MFSYRNKSVPSKWKVQAPTEVVEDEDISVQTLLLSAQQERIQLTMALQESRRMIQDLSSALQTCRSTKQEPSNSQLRQELRQLKSIVEDKDRYITNLQSLVNTLRTQGQSGEPVQALRQRLQQLLSEKKQLNEEANALVIQLNASRQNEKTLTQRVMECQQLETAHKQLQKDMINTRSEAMLLKDELQNAKTVNAEYLKQLQTVKDLETIKAGAAKLQRVDRKKGGSSVEAPPSALAQALANVEASQLYLQQTEAKLQTCYENMAVLNEKYSKVQGQLVEYVGLLDTATANEVRLNQSLAEASKKHQALQDQYTTLKTRFETFAQERTARIRELEEIERKLREDKEISEQEKTSLAEKLQGVEEACAKDGNMMADVIQAYETFVSNGNLVNQYAQCLQSQTDVQSCRSLFVKMPESYPTVRQAMVDAGLIVPAVKARKVPQAVANVGSISKKPYVSYSLDDIDNELEED